MRDNVGGRVWVFGPGWFPFTRYLDDCFVFTLAEINDHVKRRLSRGGLTVIISAKRTVGNWVLIVQKIGRAPEIN
jgi:hypothetical protein